ncbi:Hypothetical protein PHPALM_14581 [Phytophthora palmivora]|uniref:Nbr1 FW domain-containing protein n=1 Tax=Phytophthora palmivora TaxID=4796 RepID=A0A2P4XUF4_9STRA|nr:Hypothetical protein PHPALM_14581 [Phytophthora palmivora]
MADDLLQMFQSITTSDHDELVDQFAHLLQLDVHTASFFLESCNWNVETAANNYLATMEATGAPTQSQQPNSASYQAQFISDLSATQNTLFAPDTPVHMQWSFVNTGGEAWPEGTRLLFAQGSSFQGPEQIAVAAQAGTHEAAAAAGAADPSKFQFAEGDRQPSSAVVEDMDL